MPDVPHPPKLKIWTTELPGSPWPCLASQHQALSPVWSAQTCDPVRASEPSLLLPGTRCIDTPPPGLSRALQDTWVRRSRDEEEIRRPFSAQFKGESGEVYSKLRSPATLSPPRLCSDVHPAWRPEAHWPPTASRLPLKSADKLPWRTACGRDSPAQNLAERSCKRVSLRVLPEMQSGNFSKFFFFFLNQNRLIQLRKSCV